MSLRGMPDTWLQGEIERVLQGVNMPHFLPVKFEIEARDGVATIGVLVHTMNRDGEWVDENGNRSKTIWVKSGRQITAAEVLRDPLQVVDLVRQVLHVLLTHEVDEHLQYQGRRIYDPHPEKQHA